MASTTSKAKKPTKAQVEALRQKVDEALKAWNYGAGSEEQRQAYFDACKALEAAKIARRPSLAQTWAHRHFDPETC